MSYQFPNSSSHFVLKLQILRLLNYLYVCLTFPPESFFGLEYYKYNFVQQLFAKSSILRSQEKQTKQPQKNKNTTKRNNMELKNMKITLNYRKA